jgi:hypothetical protein
MENEAENGVDFEMEQITPKESKSSVIFMLYQRIKNLKETIDIQKKTIKTLEETIKLLKS